MNGQMRDFIPSLAGAYQNVDELDKKYKEVKPAELSNKEADKAAQVLSKASDKEKQIAATGVSAAVNEIQDAGTLKGNTFESLVKKYGLDTQDASKKEMSNAELITRFSLAVLPGIAGYLGGRASGAANPFLMGAAASEAGMRGLAYMNELDKQKKESADKLKSERLRGALEEARDTRKFQQAAGIEALREQGRMKRAEMMSKTAQEKYDRTRGEEDVGFGFAMNPKKRWTPKDRQKVQSTVATYATHEAAVDNVLNVLEKYKKTPGQFKVPGSAAAKELEQAQSSYMDSYRMWSGSGANFVASEREFAQKTLGIDLGNLSFNTAIMLSNPQRTIDGVKRLKQQMAKRTEAAIKPYGGELAPQQERQQQPLGPIQLNEAIANAMTDEEVNAYEQMNGDEQQELLRSVINRSQAQ